PQLELLFGYLGSKWYGRRARQDLSGSLDLAAEKIRRKILQPGRWLFQFNQCDQIRALDGPCQGKPERQLRRRDNRGSQFQFHLSADNASTDGNSILAQWNQEIKRSDIHRGILDLTYHMKVSKLQRVGQ